jgi:hypothetical protein
MFRDKAADPVENFLEALRCGAVLPRGPDAVIGKNGLHLPVPGFEDAISHRGETRVNPEYDHVASLHSGCNKSECALQKHILLPFRKTGVMRAIPDYRPFLA